MRWSVSTSRAVPSGSVCRTHLRRHQHLARQQVPGGYAAASERAGDIARAQRKAGDSANRTAVDNAAATANPSRGVYGDVHGQRLQYGPPVANGRQR